ncbi:cytidine deaminase [Sporolactobacillus shoreicorticis]|uniref:Cytidine deaminase family protein n=1 Tax=Sporolactobacillus shoreicorticis TaxID=1923877 RepID=A0ABW5S3K3_9BACL|nr:cytidine deaminase [Sporolactobacillus shoreicorticis]MCO7126491.1 cytidine deaminase [Sporolactobacillus shoreicorticis]
MDFSELKRLAEEKVNPRALSEDCQVASVASALVKGNVYVGVCIDTACSLGFCAEHAAIAQMITHEESRIAKIVAVGRKGKILPPCGRCRAFIYFVNHENIETDVMLSATKIMKIKELLPYII